MLEQLNKAQKKAVETTDGPLLVLAGAGTGKTRVLIYRIAHLISTGKARPGEVLGITFTRKAALEMRERLMEILDPLDAKQVTLSTFHALGSQILREYGADLGLATHFGIADETDTRTIVRDVLKQEGVQPGTKGERPSEVIERICSAKQGLLELWMREYWSGEEATTKHLTVYRSGNTELFRELQGKLQAPDLERFSRIYHNYQERLENDELVDYDDLITLPVLLFLEHPEILRLYQKRWKYLLVDEYQDTDFVQDHLLRLLAGEDKNLCVVGDDDQAIYSWRGAKVENIRTFPDRYPGCQVVALEENYRSTPEILKVANAVLEARPEVKRHQKMLWTQNESGEVPKVWVSMTQETEALAIAEDIEGAIESGEINSLDDVIVLYRVNSLARAVEEAFRRNKIRFRIVSSTPLQQRKEVRDILAYFKISANPKDTGNFARAVSTPSRGVGPATIESVVAHSRKNAIDLLEAAANAEFITGLKRPQVDALTEFAGIIGQIQEKIVGSGISGGLHYLLEITSIRDDLIRELARLDEEDDFDEYARVLRKIHDIEDFILYVEEFAGVMKRDKSGGEAELLGLRRFLDELFALNPAEVELRTDEEHDDMEDGEEEPRDAVTLMTVHAAKGLEAPRVYIAGLEEQVFPLHSREEAVIKDTFDFSDAHMSEESRLFYVALTRAEKTLILSASRTRELYRGEIKPMKMSRFIAALPETGFVFSKP